MLLSRSEQLVHLTAWLHVFIFRSQRRYIYMEGEQRFSNKRYTFVKNDNQSLQFTVTGNFCKTFFEIGIHWNESFKGTVPRKSMWALKVNFSEKTTVLPFIWVWNTSNTAITTRSWDYLVYLHDLALHKDHLPHHRMASQSAKQLCNYDVI